jgi:hypothetical protein
MWDFRKGQINPRSLQVKLTVDTCALEGWGSQAFSLPLDSSEKIIEKRRKYTK